MPLVFGIFHFSKKGHFFSFSLPFFLEKKLENAVTSVHGPLSPLVVLPLLSLPLWAKQQLRHLLRHLGGVGHGDWGSGGRAGVGGGGLKAVYGNGFANVCLRQKPRLQGVDTDPWAGRTPPVDVVHFTIQTGAKSAEAALAGRVDTRAGYVVARLGENGGDVDDVGVSAVAATRLRRGASRLLSDKQLAQHHRRHEVDVDDVLDLGGGGAQKQLGLRHARTVHQDVDAPQQGPGASPAGAEKRLYLLGLLQIKRDVVVSPLRQRVLGVQFRRGRPQYLLVPGQNRNPAAQGGNLLGNGLSKTLGSARN